MQVIAEGSTAPLLHMHVVTDAGCALRTDWVLARWQVGGHQVAFPLMRAGHYPLAAFLATAAAVAPQAVFARHVAASLAGRLPTDFMCVQLSCRKHCSACPVPFAVDGLIKLQNWNAHKPEGLSCNDSFPPW